MAEHTEKGTLQNKNTNENKKRSWIILSSNNVNSTEANKANNYNINNVDNKKMNNKNSYNVVSIILHTIIKRKWLSLGIIISVCGAVITALYPPLVLGKIVDTLTTGSQVPVYLVFVYMAFTVIAGLMEATREGLTVFGQKITHALRSGLMEHFVRLSTDSLNKQEPGAVVSRFVGDVDTVENLFTSGIVSMFADACKIISILVVIWFRNKGLATVLIVLLPFLFWFTRHIQKNMLDAQLKIDEQSAVLQDMYRKHFTISVRSIILARRSIWRKDTMNI